MDLPYDVKSSPLEKAYLHFQELLDNFKVVWDGHNNTGILQVLLSSENPLAQWKGENYSSEIRLCFHSQSLAQWLALSMWSINDSWGEKCLIIITVAHLEAQTSLISLVKRNTVSQMHCGFLLCEEEFKYNHKSLELEGPMRWFIATPHSVLDNSHFT